MIGANLNNAFIILIKLLKPIYFNISFFSILKNTVNVYFIRKLRKSDQPNKLEYKLFRPLVIDEKIPDSPWDCAGL